MFYSNLGAQVYLRPLQLLITPICYTSYLANMQTQAGYKKKDT